MLIIVGYLALSFILTSIVKTNRKITLFILFLVGVFIIGYRSVTFTADNIAYAEYYIMNSHYSLRDSWQRVIDDIGKDPFYYFVGNLFSSRGITYRGWFIFIAAVFLGGFFLCVYKYSEDDFISIAFLVCMSYLYFSTTALRQTLATGILFFAFIFAQKKKFLPFILLVILASMFHSSALIFLPVYFIADISIGIKQVVLLVAGLVTAILFPTTINRIIERFAWDDSMKTYVDVETGLSWFGYIVQAAILIFCVFLLSESIKKKEDKNTNLFVNAMIIGLFFQSFVVNVDNLFRISMYYSICGAFALPKAINSLKDTKNRVIIKSLVLVAMLAYFFYSSSFKYFTMFGGLTE